MYPAIAILDKETCITQGFSGCSKCMTQLHLSRPSFISGWRNATGTVLSDDKFFNERHRGTDCVMTGAQWSSCHVGLAGFVHGLRLFIRTRNFHHDQPISLTLA